MKKSDKKLENLEDQKVETDKVTGGRKSTYSEQQFMRRNEEQGREDDKK